MGARSTRLAAGLGWLGSAGVHLIALCSALGVIPLHEGLAALRERIVDLDEKATPAPPVPPEPDSATRVRVPEPPPPQAPPDPPPEPPSQEQARPEPPPEPPEPLEPPEVTLGIDESDATDTETWLGFAHATPEHGGMPIGYEQAQLTRAPGAPSTAAMPRPVGLATTNPAPNGAGGGEGAGDAQGDRPEERTRESARRDRPSEAFVAAGALPTITLAREETTPSAPDAPDAPGAGTPTSPGLAAATLRRTAEAIERLTTEQEGRPAGGPGASGASGGQGVPGAARAVDETANATPEAAPLQRPGAGGEKDAAGFLSDRDADAAALAQAIAVNPGKPLAARGLRIQTVRPKWSTYALATASPNDVAVRIWFDASGRVTKAEIIQSSGREDVDRPILDAVYRWRATGERLSMIAAQPDGRVQLVFRIDLER